MPLAHRPGHAQVDLGEADGYISGKLVHFHIIGSRVRLSVWNASFTPRA
ncbi:MAG: hypothetical protein H0U72_06530 [Nitrosospira sp.]|nr:hypothetical protein [Nitrosospira sp.]